MPDSDPEHGVDDPTGCGLNQAALLATLRDRAAGEHVSGEAKKGARSSSGGGGKETPVSAAERRGYAPMAEESTPPPLSPREATPRSFGDEQKEITGIAAGATGVTLELATWVGDVQRTPYAVIVDRPRRAVVVAVRGSLSPNDAATDVIADGAPLPHGVAGHAPGEPQPSAHRGMLRTAERIFAQLDPPGAASMHLHPDDDDWMDDGDSDDADDAADEEESSYGANGDVEASTSARARHGSTVDIVKAARRRRAVSGGCRRLLRRILLHWHRSLATAVDASFSDQVRRPSPSVGRRPLTAAERATAHGGRTGSVPSDMRGHVLRRLLVGDGAPCAGYELVLTGHSLGAGVASLLALLLKRAWRDVPVRIRCFALSPPGGLLSRPVAEAMREFTLSCVVGTDCISRLSPSTAELLRDEALAAWAECDTSKGKIYSRAVKKVATQMSTPRASNRVSQIRGTRAVSAPLLLKTEVVDSRDGFDVRWAESQLRPAAREMIATHTATRPQRSTAFYPPGRVLWLTELTPDEEEDEEARGGVDAGSRSGGGRGCCHTEGAYRAHELADARPLQRLIMGTSMLTDHFPDRVLGALQSALRRARAEERATPRVPRF